MLYKKIFFCLSILLMLTTSLVQTQNYYLHVLEEEYTNLNNSIPLSLEEVWDDPDYVVPIGFDFQYKHIVTDTLYFGGLGGTLFFNDPIAFDYEYNSDFVLYCINPTIIDLIDRANINNGSNPTISLSPISYQLDYGNNGRILKIEWKNAGSYGEIFQNEISNDFINLQVWFYEGTNDIAIHFGSSLINYPQYTYEDIGEELIVLGPYDWIEEMVDPTTIDIFFIHGDDPLNPNLSLVRASELNDDLVNSLTLNAPVPEHTVYYLSLDSIPPMNEPIATNLQDSKSQTITLYPNPSENSLFIRGLDSKNHNFKIYDVFGKLVQEDELSANQSINTSLLTSGSYILEIVTDENTIIKKFLKN